MTLREWYQQQYPVQSLYGERIRALGLYQPFASLMHHGKIETRWVLKGKKPPFPTGLYLFYSTKKRYEYSEILDISGRMAFDNMNVVLKGDNTVAQLGYALSIGELYQVGKMTRDIEQECFVEYKQSEEKDLIALRFRKVQQLEPYQWHHGKQGIGFVPDFELDNIKMKY